MKNHIMSQQPTNPSSIKTRFAMRFLRAMKKLNEKKPSSASTANRYKRYRYIRAAACASMASAVGPRMAWSRAVLRKIGNRTLHHRRTNKVKNRRGFSTRKRRGFLRANPRQASGKANDLRGLVPGGNSMEFSELLSETAHYVKCLRDQVQVMTNILEYYST